MPSASASSLPNDEESVDAVGCVADGLVEEVPLGDDSHCLVVRHVEHGQVCVDHYHPDH